MADPNLSKRAREAGATARPARPPLRHYVVIADGEVATEENQLGAPKERMSLAAKLWAASAGEAEMMARDVAASILFEVSGRMSVRRAPPEGPGLRVPGCYDFFVSALGP